MTRSFDRDARGRLPVAEPGELPCLNRHPWTGYGCQAATDHKPPCRYYSERGWHAEWYPGPAVQDSFRTDDDLVPRRDPTSL
jgi:hypothetical protein